MRAKIGKVLVFIGLAITATGLMLLPLVLKYKLLTKHEVILIP